MECEMTEETKDKDIMEFTKQWCKSLTKQESVKLGNKFFEIIKQYTEHDALSLMDIHAVTIMILYLMSEAAGIVPEDWIAKMRQCVCCSANYRVVPDDVKEKLAH
jgi:hypothetical protein